MRAFCAQSLRLAGAALSLCAIAALQGCGGGGGSIVGPTTLEFKGLTPQDANAVESMLRSEGLVVVRKDGAQGTTFETRSITSAKKLGKIHEEILNLAHDKQIEMTYQGATLAYSSLTASGSATTTATIQASPGATAYIADQDGSQPWRLIRLDRSGRWQGPVRTQGRVSAQGGWLYVAFTRDGHLFRYLRVNVLTGQQETTSYSQAQRTGLTEPPPTGPAEGGAPSATESGAETKSKSTFKWPWQ